MVDLELVKSIVGRLVRYFRNETEKDEFIQDACLTAVRAEATFDPDRGTMWATYLERAIRNRYADWVKEKKKEERFISLAEFETAGDTKRFYDRGWRQLADLRPPDLLAEVGEFWVVVAKALPRQESLEIIERVFRQGWRVAEVAENLALDGHQCTKQKARALEELRQSPAMRRWALDTGVSVDGDGGPGAHSVTRGLSGRSNMASGRMLACAPAQPEELVLFEEAGYVCRRI